MGKIKQQMIREEDAVTAAVNRRVARVSVGGGDAMSGGMMAVLASLESEAEAAGMTLEEFALAEETKAAEDEVHGALLVADQADKELDRNPALVSTLPAPPEPEVDPEVITPEILFEMPPQRYMKQGQHYSLVFQGVCTNCAHCALKLTDSVSIERGLGPICSKRGYMEDPTNPDEIQAMIDLAEYPALVDFLVKSYKPKGVRGLMNGLVKICSLNRRSPVHQACCDAVESLGYKRLSYTLRESLKAVEIKHHDANNYSIWVKKAEWSWNWTSDVRRQIPASFMNRQAKGLIVPRSEKQVLWALVLKHYEGLIAVVPDGEGGKKAVKIKKEMTAPTSNPQLNPT
jgi:Family of unknown function (DUF6011)